MRKLVALIALGLSALGPVPAAFADDPPASTAAPKLEGSWEVVDAAAAQATIEAAIEGVVADMNFIKRPIARSRLRKANGVLTSIRMAWNGDELVYTYNGGNVIRTKVGGPAVAWTSPEGDACQVKTALAGQRLTLTIAGAEGTKVETFDLAADGASLAYQATVTASALPKPLRYGYAIKRK